MFLDHPLSAWEWVTIRSRRKKRLAERHVRTTVDSHNIYLQILATRGLFGFLPFVGYCAVLVMSLWKLSRRAAGGSLARYYAIGALGVTAPYSPAH
jgi:O-antigen ligase